MPKSEQKPHTCIASFSLKVFMKSGRDLNKLKRWLNDNDIPIHYIDRDSHRLTIQTRENEVGDWIDGLAEQEGIDYISFRPHAISNKALPPNTPNTYPTEQTGADAIAQQARERHGAHTWHDAGFTGTGIKVGIIDSSFSQYQQILLDHYGSDNNNYLCFDDSGSTNQTTLPDCGSQSNQHGTQVARGILDIAPNATTYISNANTPDRVKTAVDWMVDNQVKIISMAQAFPWDGPGDGTSPSDSRGDEYSPLNSLRDAINAGIIWINSAGNTGRGTWFSRSPSFINDTLDFDPDQAGLQDCLTISNPDNNPIAIDLRWHDNWARSQSEPGARIDLDLILYAITGTSKTVTKQSDEPQSGQTDHVPTEVIMTMLDPGPAAPRYCVTVTKNPDDTTPDANHWWVQIAHQGRFPISTNPAGGGILNPAESADPRMLAVGATTVSDSPAVEAYSARGPAPEPPPDPTIKPDGRIKPDIVATGNTRGVSGTSFAAPNLTGLVVLVIDALEHNANYDQTQEIVDFLKETAIQHGTPDHNNSWGHGFAYLPQPTEPQLNSIVPAREPSTSVDIRFTPGECEPLTDTNPTHRLRFYQVSDSPPGDETLRTQTNPDADVLIATHLIQTPTTAQIVRTFDEGFQPGRDYYVSLELCFDVDQTTHCAEPVISPNWQIRASLTVPQDLRLSTSPNGLQLEWTPVDEATGYAIHHFEGNRITHINQPRLTLRNVRAGDNHTFRIRSKQGQDSSDWSDPVEFTIPAYINPPNGLQVTLSNGSAILRWNRPTNVHEDHAPPSLRYEIEMTGYSQLNIQSIPATQHTFRNLRPGKTYTFRVSASVGNGIHISSWSQTLAYTMQLETPNISVVQGDSAQLLRWTAVQNATQYQVRKSNPSGYTITVTTTQHVIPELELHHVHHFRVRAATADFQSPWSPPTSIMAGNPPPTAPTVTDHTAQPNGIILTWATVPRADSYTVQQWDGPKNKWRFLPFTEEGQDEPYQVTINATPSATITNLTPTVTYSHRVFAINSNGRNGSQPVHTVAGGQSPTPAPSPTTTPPPAKMPPTNLQAQVAGQTVNLSWTAHTNPNYTTLIVRRRVAGQTPLQWTDFSVNIDATAYADSSIPADGSYVYRVRAAKDNGHGGMTNAVTATVDVP